MDDDSYANRLLAAKGLVDGWLADDKLDHFLLWHPDTYIFKSVKARRVTDGGGPEYTNIDDAGSTGQFGTGMQVAANGPVIIWNTDGGARRVGKTFISGIAPENINAGEITQLALSNFMDAASSFRTPFPAAGGSTPTCTFCIPRRTDLSIRSLVVDYQISRDVGSQRRRNLPV
jgi:hypothetical protein